MAKEEENVQNLPSLSADQLPHFTLSASAPSFVPLMNTLATPTAEYWSDRSLLFGTQREQHFVLSNPSENSWSTVERKRGGRRNKSFSSDWNRTASSSGRLQKCRPGGVSKRSQCFSCQAKIEEVMLCIETGHSILVLMRGVPGSGKSTLAKQLKRNGEIFSTDEYFRSHNGNYNWNPTQLEEAHRWNFQRAAQAMEGNVTPVIIDNTNIRIMEMRRYALAAVKHGYEIYCLEPETAWKYKAGQCANRNAHGVSKGEIQRMLDNFDRYVTIETLTRTRATNPVSYFTIDDGTGIQRGGESDVLHTTINNESENFDIISKVLRENEEDLWENANFSAWGLEEPKNVEAVDPESSTVTCSASDSNPKAQRPDRKVQNEVTPLFHSESDAAFVSSSVDVKNQNSGVENDDTKLLEADNNKAVGCKKQKAPSSLGDISNNSWLLPSFLQGGLKSGVDDCNLPVSSSDSTSCFSLIPTCKLPREVDRVAVRSCGVVVSEKLLLLASTAHRRIKTARLDMVGCDISREEMFSYEKMLSDLPKIDCGEQTESVDLENENVRILQDLFPDANFQDLEHVATTCENDINWAVNVLLDSAFRFDISNSRTEWQNGGVKVSCLDTNGSVEQNTEISGDKTELKSDDSYSVSQPSELPYDHFPDLVEEGSSKSSSCPEFVVSLELDPAFADQLQDLFGLLSEDNYIPAELLYPEQLKVDLPLELAAEIHKHWLLTLKAKFGALPNLLNASSSTSENVGAGNPNNLDDEATALALQSIEDEESARLLAEEEEFDTDSVCNAQTLATKLKRQKLKEIFPGVDEYAVDEIFTANRFKMDPTIEVLSSLGHRAYSSSDVLKENKCPKLSSSISSSSTNISLFGRLTYNDLRMDAQLHGEARKECFRKARDAYRNNQAAAAHYYSSEGHKHNQKLKEANLKAEQMILEERKRTNPSGTLDLHGLHVAEAVRALLAVLREYDRPLEQRGSGHGKKLRVITGQGKHSAQGPKIKPAIVGFLKQRQYKFEEISCGVLNVFCK